MNQRIYNQDGQLVYSETYDTATGQVTIYDRGETVTRPADPAVLAAIAESAAIGARHQRLEQAAATLRQWAADARGVNVAPMNVSQHKQVTQTLVDRLEVFFDRFADLLDERA